jgi:hypothetical protein
MCEDCEYACSWFDMGICDKENEELIMMNKHRRRLKFAYRHSIRSGRGIVSFIRYLKYAYRKEL